MKFSKTTDYALRVMIALAKAGEERLSLQVLAKREGIPRKFLEHVVRNLKEAELLKSSPGPKGGYSLREPPALISISRILIASQGPLLSTEHMDGEGLPEHAKEPVVRLRRVMEEIRMFARQRLESITLADLAHVEEAGVDKDVIMYYI
ncbi:MAG: Rrf2 family transcriptional regulator [Candidatus Hinthialibacter antarcticus]|nr:Rrf2 family transcriptional regulator [Candidatus Hinthialibacter antarcticus]